MSDLADLIIQELSNINSRQLKGIKKEIKFQQFIYEILNKRLDRSVKIKTQDKSNKYGRQTAPDISIGYNRILIELKFDLKKLNDIYRLFYQAVKYSKQAKELLILLVHDPRRMLNRSDIEDLEKFDKVKVLRIY